jgi:hypothetical protein
VNQGNRQGTNLIELYAQRRLNITNPWAYLLPRGHYVAIRTDNQYFVFEFARLNERDSTRATIDNAKGICMTFGGTVHERNPWDPDLIAPDVDGQMWDRNRLEVFECSGISLDQCGSLGGNMGGRRAVFCTVWSSNIFMQ